MLGTCIPTPTWGLPSPSPGAHPPRIPTATSGLRSRRSKRFRVPGPGWEARSRVREAGQLGLHPPPSHPTMGEARPRCGPLHTACPVRLPWQGRCPRLGRGRRWPRPHGLRKRQPRGGMQFPRAQPPPGDVPSAQVLGPRTRGCPRAHNAGQSRRREAEVLASPRPLP